MIKTFTNLFFTTVLFAVNSQAQTIQEPDYTLNYKDNKIEVTFNKGVSLKAFDIKTQTQKRVARDLNQNTFVLDSLNPAQVIKLEYTFNDDTSRTAKANRRFNNLTQQMLKKLTYLFYVCRHEKLSQTNLCREGKN